MNQEIKDRWLEALRTGGYTQGTGYLKTERGFCCLGVLLEVTEDIHKTPWSEPFPNGYYNDVQECDGSPYLISLRLGALLGLPDVLQDELTEMNDNGKSFKEIADWIEENL